MLKEKPANCAHDQESGDDCRCKNHDQSFHGAWFGIPNRHHSIASLPHP